MIDLWLWFLVVGKGKLWNQWIVQLSGKQIGSFRVQSGSRFVIEANAKGIMLRHFYIDISCCLVVKCNQKAVESGTIEKSGVASNYGILTINNVWDCSSRMTEMNEITRRMSTNWSIHWIQSNSTKDSPLPLVLHLLSSPHLILKLQNIILLLLPLLSLSVSPTSFLNTSSFITVKTSGDYFCVVGGHVPHCNFFSTRASLEK